MTTTKTRNVVCHCCKEVVTATFGGFEATTVTFAACARQRSMDPAVHSFNVPKSWALENLAAARS